MEQLRPREEEILGILISAHVDTGEPVGSRSISKSGLGLSAATVRNSMADLEDKGFLTHPHTSAGRTPTDKGYRYYVDRLMPAEQLSEEDQGLIRQVISGHALEGDSEEVLEQVSKVIADVSSNLGVALTPRFEGGTFERMEIVPLSGSKLLIVLTISSGLVKTMVMEVDASIKTPELEEAKRRINERLAGLTVGEIKASFGERIRSISGGSPKLLRLLSDNAQSLFQFDTGHLHIGGTSNFFLQPEFSENREELAALFGLLEDRESIASLLDERMDSEDITITIGNELKPPELRGCSLLTSRYQMGNVSGVVGVIGPTRLPYAKMVPLIRYIAKLTENILEQG
jgi:heat-inducible transcriptional repressor